MLIREALSFGGVESDLVCFEDLPEAVAALPELERVAPDLVLLDIRLTRGDGLEFLRYMHQSTVLRHVPAIVLTSSASRADRESAARAGAFAFVPKPTQLDDFLEQISGAVKAALSRAAGA